jgi:serine/threonine protein phosphatase PrpC
MLGDRFLKEQDVGFIAKPYVSEGLRVEPQEEALLVMASDGLWDVVSQERVAALAAKAAAAAAAAAAGATSSSSGQGVEHMHGDGFERAAAATVACDGGSGMGGSSSSSRVGNKPRKSVAAAVADELMQAALRLHSKDDISILVLHVLPAAVAVVKRQADCTASTSGSM